MAPASLLLSLKQRKQPNLHWGCVVRSWDRLSSEYLRQRPQSALKSLNKLVEAARMVATSNDSSQVIQ